MKIRTASHRDGENGARANPYLNEIYSELVGVIESISDAEIKNRFNQNTREAKSISQAINELINERLIATPGWTPQSKIFKDSNIFKGKTWTLDFAKNALMPDGKLAAVSVEVVFNHREAIAWNLMKLALAAEKNHVKKEVEVGTGVGVFICATKDMWRAGGFDNSVTDFDTVIKYLEPLEQLITARLIVIGLEAPESFYVEVLDHPTIPKKKFGKIREITS
jgi:hypothetical protein